MGRKFVSIKAINKQPNSKVRKDSGEGVLTSVIGEEEDRNYAKIPT
jgi:hypothetical protein